MKATLKRTSTKAKEFVRSRPKEVKWSLVGAVIGLVMGLAIGGVGLAALGSAVSVPASAVLAIIGALIGNRLGVGLEFTRN